MKLLAKTSLFYLLFALPVLAICSFICYHLVYKEVKDSIDEGMWKDMQRIEQQLDKTDTIANITSVLDSGITIVYANDSLKKNFPATNYAVFSDTSLYDHFEQEILPFRNLKKIYPTKKHEYFITIFRPYLESDDLADSILTAVVIMLACLLIGFFLINLFVSRRLWRPFYRTLEILQEYELDKGGSIRFSPARVREFNALNMVLNKMTSRIYRDFMNQKQFAENASHEMQTPLAVIKNKIELLIQSKTICAADMEIIQGIYNSANKLSQINKALLLLSKIESNRFAEVKEINLSALLEHALEHFADMASIKNIQVQKKIEPQFFVSMNPQLADVLINNLLQNAIRHNIKDGKITITLAERKLTISNTGSEYKDDPNEMFARFRKSDQSSDSIGLGMSIIKQVCDYYDFAVSYHVEGIIHTLSLQFL